VDLATSADLAGRARPTAPPAGTSPPREQGEEGHEDGRGDERRARRELRAGGQKADAAVAPCSSLRRLRARARGSWARRQWYVVGPRGASPFRRIWRNGELTGKSRRRSRPPLQVFFLHSTTRQGWRGRSRTPVRVVSIFCLLRHRENVCKVERSGIRMLKPKGHFSVTLPLHTSAMY
jgi:hypothetical protein